MTNAWGIKLGSRGAAVEFCEERGIVGVGWRGVSLEVVREESDQHLRDCLEDVYGIDYPVSWPGTLRRFVNLCQVGDYIVYYVPQRKSFVITQTKSEAYERTSDLEDETDIWIVRDVERKDEISTLDFFAPLRGKVLGPRFSFWQLHDMGEALDALVRGVDPLHLDAPDPDVSEAINTLTELATTRLHALNASEYELLTADYFRAQGAQIVGKPGVDPVIDVRAEFPRGDLGPDEWFVQVKRYQDKPVDAGPIRNLVDAVGDSGRKCFVSAFGFTDDARRLADEAAVLLLETSDFVPLALSGSLSDSLRIKVGLPGWTTE